MTLKRTILLATLTGGLAGFQLQAAEVADEIQALKEQIKALDQKVRVLERQGELNEEAAAAKATTTPRIVAGSSGLIVSSPDTNYVFQLRGIVQVDNRTFFRDNNLVGNDGFLLRRVRPIFQGTIARDFDFLLTPDFAGSSATIFDAYANYRYRPWLQLRAGKMKVPVGLEQMQSDPVTPFNERALASSLLPNRDIGFQLWGDIKDGAVSYAIGVFNGVGDNRSTANIDFEDHREIAGRVFLQPFKSKQTALQGLGFGVGGTWGNVSSNATGLPNTTGGTLPGYSTDGQQQFFAYNPTNGTVVANGEHWRISPQAYYYWGPLGLLGEYVISNQRIGKGVLATNLEHTAWHVSAGWVLTGEDASYAGVTPRKPFDLSKRQFGAVQLVARYAELDIDNGAFPVYANSATSASKARAWAVGVNWFLNRNLRLNASFSRTTFDGGGGAGASAPATITRQAEEVLFTRLQLSF